MFGPVDGPGPNFTEVLRRVGVEPFAPVTAAGPPPFEIRHGTTIVALRYEGGVIMCGDRRATAGSSNGSSLPSRVALYRSQSKWSSCPSSTRDSSPS